MHNDGGVEVWDRPRVFGYTLEGLVAQLDELERVQRAAERGEKVELSREDKRRLMELAWRTGYVYFVYAERSNMVKIGYTGDLKNRLSDLQVGSAEPLTIISHVRGDMRLEKTLHGAFRDEWVRGEWFQPSEELVRAAEIAVDDGPKSLFDYVQGVIDSRKEVA